MVKKLNLYLKNNSSGFFHNSREDVKNLSKVII